MSVPSEVETWASGSACVSDLALRDVASELAGALSSSSGCESGVPKRTSLTSPSTTVGSSSSSVMSAKCRVRPSRTASVSLGNSDVALSIPSASSLVAGLTCVRLHLCKQFRMCTQTVSFRPGFGSSLTTHTPRPHHHCAPSFRLCMKTGSPATSTPLWLPLSTVGCCRHRSVVGGDYAPMGSCHSHSLASQHLVSGILSDHVGVNEIVFEQT